MKLLSTALTFFILAWLAGLAAAGVWSIYDLVSASRYKDLVKLPGGLIALIKIGLETRSFLLTGGLASLVAALYVANNGYRQVKGFPILPPAIGAAVFFLYTRFYLSDLGLTLYSDYLPLLAGIGYAFAGWAVNLFACADTEICAPRPDANFTPGASRHHY